MVLVVTQKEFMFLIQLLTNQELILLHILVIEEQHSTHNLTLTVTQEIKIGIIGQIPIGLHLIMASRVILREFMYLIQLHINQGPIPHLILVIEELHFMLKEMINLKEPTKELIN